MPEIRILQPGDEAALEAFLLPRVESSMFLIGNRRSAGLVDHGRPYEGTYAAAFEDETIVGVVAHYWNQNLVFQAPAHLDALWRAAVVASKRPVKGLIGPSEQVRAVKEALDVDDSRIQLDETEKLYSLELDDLIEPDNLSSGRVSGRRIEARDLELVARWRVAYSLEVLGEQDSPQLRESCRASIERSLEEGRTWVLEDRGELVACTSFNAGIEEAVQGLESASGFIRRELGSRLTIRHTPALRFHLDESIDYGDRIDSLLTQIREEREPGGEGDSAGGSEDI